MSAVVFDIDTRWCMLILATLKNKSPEEVNVLQVSGYWVPHDLISTMPPHINKIKC